MPAQPEAEKFQSSWNQTAAWAQSHGIKYNQYFPIYQEDSQNFLTPGKTVMSQAEREKAIQAVANINKPTQLTPSTAPNPTNIIGNTITDARNIFTGLIGMVNPEHNSIVDMFKNSFDDLTGAHHLAGNTDAAKLGDALTSTVLSFIPGALDVGRVLQADPNISNPWQYLTSKKGAEALAENPISSVLDILPITSKLTKVAVARDPALAERVGLSAKKGVGPNPSLGRAVKGYIFNTKTSKIGPTLDREGKPTIGPMTIGDKFHALTGRTVLKVNPAIAEVVSQAAKTNTHFGAEEQYFFNEVDRMTEHLTEDEKAQFNELWDPKKPSSLQERLKDPAISDRVKEVTREILDGPLRFHLEESIADSGGPSRITNPLTGQEEVRATSGKNKVVNTAKDAKDALTEKLLDAKVLPSLKKIAEGSDQANDLFDSHLAQFDQAIQSARLVHVDDENFTYDPYKPEPRTRVGKAISKRTKIAKGVSHTDIADRMFGTGGFASKIADKAREGRYEDVVFLTDALDEADGQVGNAGGRCRGGSCVQGGA